MPETRDDLKARLLAEAEASIERMLSDERMGQQMTLTQIEDVIGNFELPPVCRTLKMSKQQAAQTVPG